MVVIYLSIPIIYKQEKLLVNEINFKSTGERNGADHKSENLDLESRISNPVNLFPERIH